jgi:hypothetical protein
LLAPCPHPRDKCAGHVLIYTSVDQRTCPYDAAVMAADFHCGTLSKTFSSSSSVCCKFVMQVVLSLLIIFLSLLMETLMIHVAYRYRVDDSWLLGGNDLFF